MRIRNYANPSRLDWTTERLLGSTGWRTVQLGFPVSAPSRLLVVEVFRERLLKFDDQIAGSVWVDRVRLEPITP